MLIQKPLYEWRKPRVLNGKLSEFPLRLAKHLLWAYLTTVVFVVLICVCLKPFNGNEFDKLRNKAFLEIIPESMALLVFLMLASVLQWRFDFTIYQINKNGIRSKGFFRWSQIQGFWVEPSAQYDDIYFAVFLAGIRRRRMPLPQNKELRERILQTLSERIPQVPPVEEPPKYVCSNLQMIFMALFTLAYCYTLAYTYSAYIVTGKPSITYGSLLALFLIFILGPGTFGFAVLTKGRWREFQKFMFHAYLVNSFAFTLMLFFIVVAQSWLKLAGKG